MSSIGSGTRMKILAGLQHGLASSLDSTSTTSCSSLQHSSLRSVPSVLSCFAVVQVALDPRVEETPRVKSTMLTDCGVKTVRLPTWASCPAYLTGLNSVSTRNVSSASNPLSQLTWSHPYPVTSDTTSTRSASRNGVRNTTIAHSARNLSTQRS